MRIVFDLQRFSDDIYGTSKSEYITVTSSEIAIYGYGGNDTIVNDRWNSPKHSITVSGGDGNDSIVSNYGSNPYLKGDSGNDSLHVRGTDAFIGGDSGNDVIYSESQNATIEGGSGNDSIFSNDSDNVYISGGSNDDTIKVGYTSVNVSVIGGYGNDRIDLSEYASVIIEYTSGDGYDKIINFNSNDTLQIAGGSYTTNESGNDVIVEVGSGSIILEAAKGQDLNIQNVDVAKPLSKGLSYNDDKTEIIASKKFKGSAINLTKYPEVKKLNASSVTKKLKITGNPLDNEIRGGTKNDTILGGAGNDTLIGGAGNDVLTGGKGNDIFVYSKGNDVIKDYTEGSDIIRLKDATIKSWKTSGKNVIFTTTKGKITVKNGKGKAITITETKIYSNSSSQTAGLFAENNFVTNDNLSEIVKTNLSPTVLEKISPTNFENLTQENNLITYSEK